jgi:lipopolysaccharide export system permease protein
MNRVQSYLAGQIVGPLLAILGGLTGLALLTQGLAQLDTIVDDRRSGLAFLWITVLAVPQLISLILPLALFFAVIYAVNRMHSDSEIVVVYSAGMSNGQIIAPVLKIAALCALFHLALGALVQPAAFREMRETVFEVRNDLAASLVREGSFTKPAAGLTVYARETLPGGAMRDVLIHDNRKPERPTTYTAKRGWIATVEGAPALIMRDGQVQQPKPDGGIDVLGYDQYVLELGGFFNKPDSYYLKSSDRYLGELFVIDPTSIYEQENKNAFLAEGHSRIASPLLNIAMALIALAALLGGEFSRLGFGRRIAMAAGVALLVRLLALGISAACVDNPALNPLQYVFALGVASAAGFSLARARPKPGRAPPPPLKTAAPAPA